MSVSELRHDRPSGVCLQAFPSFLPHPLPALSLTPFFARSLTLVPHSLLLNRTETLATQATVVLYVVLPRTADNIIFIPLSSNHNFNL